MKPAVFLDRDGVINELILNPVSGEFEPPRSPGDLVVVSGAIQALCSLRDAGFELFLVSNQPDYAKGKSPLEKIQAVHERLDSILKEYNVVFREYYYCYHHPQGITPEYSFPCECRKPKPFFLFKAAHDYQIDLPGSWMIGDRDSDIECGKSAGTRTILIQNPDSVRYQGSVNPDFLSKNLKDAVMIILHN